MANKKTLNSIFSRQVVMSAKPDEFWPLPLDYVGVEIEVENYSARERGTLAPEWAQHVDHSLRNGVEFVTAAPVGGKQLTAALDKFFGTDHSYDTGPRTSIHIHINAADNMNVDQFRNMLALVYVIEGAVFRWADENRKWCGYCSPLTDVGSQRFVTILNENNNDRALVKAIAGEHNHDRYFGFNMAAYAKHGTVEFRYFPCTRSRDLVEKWIKFVMYVKKTALMYDSVADLLNAMDGDENLRQFILLNFTEVADDLWPHIDTMDSLGRIKDMLNTVHVPTSGAARKAGSLANPQLQSFVKKSLPDRADLIIDPEARKAASDKAYSLLEELMEDGMGDYEAYTRISQFVPSAEALTMITRAQAARREEDQRRQEANLLRQARAAQRRQREAQQATGDTPIAPPTPRRRRTASGRTQSAPAPVQPQRPSVQLEPSSVDPSYWTASWSVDDEPNF